MKKIYVILALVIAAAIAGFLYWYSSAKASVGNLNIYSGSVQLVRKNSTISASSGLAVHLSDVIRVASGGRASIILKDGSVVRLESGTEIKIAELTYNGSKLKNAAFQLNAGRMWSKVQHVQPGTDYQVETPGVVASVRGTSFNVDYKDASRAIYVYKSTVVASLQKNSASTSAVHEGELFVIRDSSSSSDFQIGPVAVPASYIDDWIVFNEREDDRLDGSSGASNVNLAQPDSNLSTTPTPVLSPSISGTDATVTPTGTGTATGAGQTGKTLQPTPTPTNQKSSPTPTASQAASVVSLTLSASSGSVQAQQSILLKVQAKYSDNSSSTVTSKVSWQQNPQLGTISADGWFTGVRAGTTTIIAAMNGVDSNPVSITVGSGGSPSSVQLTGITLSYQKIYQQGTASFYPNVQFSARANYSDNSSSDITSKCSWSVAGSAGGSINSNGLYTPRAQGSESANCAYGGTAASTDISIP